MEIRRRGWFEDLHKTRRAIDRLLPTLRAASDPVTRELYVTRLAEVTHVSREVLLAQLAERDSRGRGRSGDAESTAPLVDRQLSVPPNGVEFHDPPRAEREQFRREQMNTRLRADRRRGFRREEDWISSPARPRVHRSAGATRLEKGLVRAMLQGLDQVDYVAERWGPEHFTSPIYKRIFERMLAMTDRTLEAITEGLPASDVKTIDELVAEPAPPGEGAVDLWLTKLSLLAIDEERDRIDAQMMDPDHRPSDQEYKDLMARKEQLRMEQNELAARMRPQSPSKEQSV